MRVLLMLFVINTSFGKDLVNKLNDGDILTPQEQAYIDDAWQELEQELDENLRDMGEWYARQERNKRKDS